MPTPGSRDAYAAEPDGPLPPLATDAPGVASRFVAARSADPHCVRELDHGARITTANTGDHPLILQLIMRARQATLVEDFQSRLDEPNYRPANRLLVRRDNELIAHVHVASHIGWYEGQRIAIVRLEDFVVLPEYRDSGYGEQLLAAAESIAAAEGAVLALIVADRPELFERCGWSKLRGQGHTRASVLSVLAHLDAQEYARRRRRSAVEVRTWRHFELDKLRQLYEGISAGFWGSLYRSEASWQWLIGRKAQDQVLLALQRSRGGHANGHAADSDDAAEQAVGYAAVRGSCIIEMITAPKSSAVRVQLLARACREALDRDHHSISLYTPAADPLHELLVTAGGAWIDAAATNEPQWLMRLLAPERWIERCYPLWRRRIRAAQISRPLELAFVTPSVAYRFTLTRRSARLEPARALPADRVECDAPTFESLLTGNLSLAKTIADGRLRLSRPELAETLAALFPARLFWQSPLELLRL